MPTCQNCGEHVMERYVAVFCPPERDDPKVCPHCENLKRMGSDIREKGKYETVDPEDI